MKKIGLLQAMTCLENVTDYLVQAADELAEKNSSHNSDATKKLEDGLDVLKRLYEGVIQQRLGDEEVDAVTPDYVPFSCEEFSERIQSIQILYELLLAIQRNHGREYKERIPQALLLCADMVDELSFRLEDMVERICLERLV